MATTNHWCCQSEEDIPLSMPPASVIVVAAAAGEEKSQASHHWRRNWDGRSRCCLSIMMVEDFLI